MDLITLKPTEFNELLKQLAEIKSEIQESKKKNSLDDQWLDIQDVCLLLKISKRLLQQWRSTTPPRIPFAQFQNKIWFKASDVQAFLEENYIRGKKNKSL